MGARTPRELLERLLHDLDKRDYDVLGSNQTYRPDLDGAASQRLRAAANQAGRLAHFISSAANDMPDKSTRVVIDAIETILREIDSDFPEGNASDAFRKRTATVEAQLDRLTSVLPVTIVYQADRLLPSYESKLNTVLESITARAKELDERTKAALDQIETEAQAKIARARQTARGISLADAQKQFDTAARSLRLQTSLWAALALVCALSFFSFAMYLIQTPVDDSGWTLLYHSAVRITVLSAIAALASFCLRLTGAHVHMLHQNRHRQSLANSMAALARRRSSATLL